VNNITDVKLAAYAAPSESLVRTAVARIRDPQHRQVFFSKLENPKWVTPLAAKGFFESAPTVSIDEQGRVRFNSWPEGEYLARAAPFVPSEVTDLLLKIADSDNVIVQRVTVEAASRMPASYVAKLVKVISSYLDRPYRFWLDPVQLVAALRVLAEGGKAGEAMKLAQALYRPRARDKSVVGSSSDHAGGLESYWYAETLPTVVGLLAREPKMLSATVAWLEDWVQLDPYGQVQRSFWRDSIASNTQDTRTEPIGHALVDAVRDVARAQIDANRPLEQVITRISKINHPVGVRLILDALTHAVDRYSGPQTGPGQTRADSGESVAVRTGFSRMMDPTLLAGEYRSEYAALCRAMLPRLAYEELDDWVLLVTAPPHLSADEVRRVQGSFESTSEVTDSEVRRYQQLWQRDMLLAIGRDNLPEPLQERLDVVIADHGVPEVSRFRSGFFVGPTSPLNDEEVNQLTPEALLTYLGTWEPGYAQVDRPVYGFTASPEGLARSVTRAVAANPLGYAGQASRLAGLHGIYIQAVLEGFNQALAEGREFQWGPVLQLAEFVVSRSDDGVQTAEEYGHAWSWRFTHQQVARLVQSGLEAPFQSAIPPALYADAWRVLEPVTRSEHPTREEEEAYGPPGTDALTFSLNTARPVALRAAIRLLTALAKESSFQETSDKILAALDEHAGPTADGSMAVAAVYGEGLGLLLDVAKRWTSVRLTRLLGNPDSISGGETAGREWFDTAWAVLLAGYLPSRALFDLLRPWFMYHIRRLSNDRNSQAALFSLRSPEQSLADHVLILFATGQLEHGMNDSALTELFTHAPSELRGDALGHLGWRLKLAEGDVPPSILRRMQDLWDWRSREVEGGTAQPAELLEFYWWIASERFAPGWWLPHVAMLAKVPGFNTHAMLGAPLALAASEYPKEVLDVFAALYESRPSGAEPYDLVEHAPAVIRAALSLGDSRTAKGAGALMDRMGRDGHTDLAERVRRLA